MRGHNKSRILNNETITDQSYFLFLSLESVSSNLYHLAVITVCKNDLFLATRRYGTRVIGNKKDSTIQDLALQNFSQSERQ